jgi:hypothetical protein
MGVFVMNSEEYTCTIKNVTVFWKGKKVYEHGNSVGGQIEGDKGRRKESKLTEIL